MDAPEATRHTRLICPPLKWSGLRVGKDHNGLAPVPVLAKGKTMLIEVIDPATTSDESD